MSDISISIPVNNKECLYCGSINAKLTIIDTNPSVNINYVCDKCRKEHNLQLVDPHSDLEITL